VRNGAGEMGELSAIGQHPPPSSLAGMPVSLDFWAIVAAQRRSIAISAG